MSDKRSLPAAAAAIHLESAAAGVAARQRHVGRSMERLEDAAILTGRGRYGDDLGVKPGTLHAAILRSPHAHAELGTIDASAALAAPGVHGVLTGADLAAWSRPFVAGVKAPMEQWALAMDRVRYVGEAIPMCKQLTREPVAGKPHTGFGGRGRRSPFPSAFISSLWGR
ncbi:hypothetical protein CF70_017100 [Cupriavidus sp. SK-3]|nr:hypothetical protein CF70_017100 [Cupriavidus sp. SK-3]